jgi:hypothetical protein
MSTIVAIARIRAGSRIGLVASSRQFLAEMARTLGKMRIPRRSIAETVDSGEDELAAFVEEERVDALIVSPSRRRQAEAVAGGREVVEFLFAPDEASVNNIRVALMEAKERRRMGGPDARADN